MRRYAWLLIVMLCCVGLMMAGGDPKAGQAAFDKSCKTCHLSTGAPVVKVAAMLKVEMKDLRAKEVQSLSDAQMKKIVVEGQGKMKAAKNVSDKEVGDIIAFVRTLK